MGKSSALEVEAGAGSRRARHRDTPRGLDTPGDYVWGGGVFLVEVALWSGAVGAGYHWGSTLVGTAGGVALAAFTLALVGGCWGRWMAPKASRRLRLGRRVTVGVVLIAGTSAALIPLIGTPVAGIAVGAAAVFAAGQTRLDGKA